MENLANNSAQADMGSDANEAALPSEKTVQTKTRQPLPGPNDDVRPRMGKNPAVQRYYQGDVLPATSSVLISNSKYLNDPYFREAFATQALRRHGHDLPTTYMVPLMMRAIDEVTDYKRFAELLSEERKKYPELAEWLDRRHFMTIERDDVSKYPAGTLGAKIYDFMGIPGMDLELGGSSKSAESDLEFFLKGRGGPRHDIEHMISGFGPDTAGENALAMTNVVANSRFLTPELANYASMSLVWITSTGYSRTAFNYHHLLPVYLNAMQQGISAGLKVKQPLYMVEWEKYFDWPLEDIAPHLGFERGPAEEWSWTTESAAG